MAYRKLTIGTEKYEYVIGRKCTKIRGFKNEIVPNEKLGYPVGGGQHYISPGLLVEYLTTGKVEQITVCCRCKKQDPTVHFRPEPFAAEIHGKYYYAHLCNDCDDELAQDI